MNNKISISHFLSISTDLFTLLTAPTNLWGDHFSVMSVCLYEGECDHWGPVQNCSFVPTKTLRTWGPPVPSKLIHWGSGQFAFN